MRPRTLAFLALGLAVCVALPALAAAKGPDPNRAARHAELKAARAAALDSFHENRTAILDAYQERLHAIKDSYLENKTQLLDDCKEARNATRGYGYGANNSAEAKCVHDGMKLLHASARENMTDAREDAHTALKAARSNALAAFAAARAAAIAAHGKPSD